MSRALSTGLAHACRIGGIRHTVSAACTHAALAIGRALPRIPLDKQHIILAGGSEELHPASAMGFEAMSARSKLGHDGPPRAAPPCARDRDGFVLAADADVLVLESLVCAERERIVPPLSSIEYQSGHAPGAAGALDAIASLLMLQHGFVAGLGDGAIDSAFADTPRATSPRALRIERALSNSFGFGGNCGSLLFPRYADAGEAGTP